MMQAKSSAWSASPNIIRSTAAGQSAPEALRLLIHAVLEYRHDKLGDDATILMVEWQPPDP
ncbi:hypothetical protein ACWHLZ_01835 [Streptomyces chartreusis]|uniref:hypothetical protein n=1 Tax=Streptomyces chartreusis TaxID=1969 RepID=UPI003F4D5B90